MQNGKPRLALSRRKFMGFAALAGVLAASPALAKGRTLRGEVSYRERIALPPEALLEVRLLDISLADAPAKSLAVTQVKTRHRLPIPYRLHVDEAKIKRGHTYALEARITVHGKLWFITTTRHQVFSGAPRETDIRVDFIKSASTAAISPHGRWRAETIRNRGVMGKPESVLEIAEDGKVSGTAGCNRIMGQMTVSGAHINFSPMSTTRMLCAEDVMDQEGKFLAALGDARLWRIDEQRDKLILVDGQGVTILRLVRM